MSAESDWKAKQAGALLEGHRIIKAESEIEQLVDIVANWLPELRGVFAVGAPDAQIYHLRGADQLVADLRSSNFDKWANWLDARDYAPGLSILPADVAVDLLMGQAAGRYFGRQPGRASLSIADEALCLFRNAWQAFTPAAAKLIAQQPTRTNELIMFLQDQINCFTSAPRHMASVHGAQTCAMVEAFRTDPQLSDVWQEKPSSSGLLIDDPMAFDVLYRCDPQAFITLLDTFPHPEPARQIMGYVAAQIDLNQLLYLLSLSPIAFDMSGQWLTQSKTPFLILSNVMEKLGASVSSIEAETKQPNARYEPEAHLVIDAVMARPDAVYLGYAWLQEIIATSGFSRRIRPADDQVVGEAFRFLLVETARSLPVRDDAINWISNENEIWRRGRAIAAIAAHALGKPNGHIVAAQIIEALFERELLRAVGFDESISKWSTPERFLVGASIATIPSPASWFSALWNRLMPFRDRSRHSFGNWSERSSDIDLILILISWSLCGLERMPHDAPEARLFWLELHRAMRETILTESSVPWPSQWRTQYRFLAGLLAVRLNHGADDSAQHDLRDFLAPLLQVDVKLADVLLMLRDMKIPMAKIVQSVPDSRFLIELVQIIAVEQADLNGRRPQTYHTGPLFHETIRGLSAELSAAAAAEQLRAAGS